MIHLTHREQELQENIQQVQFSIEIACRRSHRSPEEVTLIAVSKTKPVEDINYAISNGLYVYGENKVQELTSKIEQIPNEPPVQWHMIGHLQKNKVKYIVGQVELIHSVDSYELAKKIQEESAKKDVITNILIEVNIANEPTKYGVQTIEVLPLIESISQFPNIRVKGLMTIAPFVDNPEDNREYFRNLKKLAVDIKSKNIDNVTMSILSMGMTGDYEVAIEEGATMVRVGTGIFGERDYLSLRKD